MSQPQTPEPEIQLVPLSEGGLELELGEMETMSLRSLLEANGIETVVMGASQMPNLPYEIFVPAAQLEDALRVIREAQASGAAAAEEAEQAGEAAGAQPPEA
jgi:hypothetical protein